MKKLVHQLIHIAKILIITPFEDWIYDVKKYKYVKTFFKSIKNTNLLNKTIVFNTVRYIRREFDGQFLLAKILALNGAKVKILLDDGILEHWDTIQISHLPKIQKIKKYPLNPYRLHYRTFFSLKFFYASVINNTRLFVKKGLSPYKGKNIEFIFYSDIIERNKINYENWQELKKHAESSTIRFFERVDLDYTNEYVKYYYDLSLKNAVLSRNVGDYILNIIKPDFFINPHGTYSTHGPAFELVKQNGIESFVLLGGYIHSRNPNVLFLSDTIIQLLSSSKYWKRYKETTVNEKIRETIINYFESRIKGSTRDTKAYYTGIKNELKVDINDGYKYHIAMFPNVLWDGNVKDRNIIFDGNIDWLISTIDYIRKRNDIKLYIKAHPGEIIYNIHAPSVLDIIKSRVSLTNVENIVLIPADQKINTYNFLRSGIDLGICYDGFLALELPYLKIPALMCVNGGFTAVEGGNYIAKTREEYFKYLENIEITINDFKKNHKIYLENIIRYLYWYFYVQPIEFPILSEDSNYRKALLKLKKKDPILDKKLIEFFK